MYPYSLWSVNMLAVIVNNNNLIIWRAGTEDRRGPGERIGEVFWESMGQSGIYHV